MAATPVHAEWFDVKQLTPPAFVGLVGAPRARGRDSQRSGLSWVSLPAAAVPGRSNREDEALRIGKITVGSLNEWALTPGTVTSWHPTPAAAEKARHAPVSSVPVSYMQGQHLRNYCDRTAAGLNFSRQIIASCDVPGECDIAAMDHALNAYLRRHDTFRSWFEHTDDDDVRQAHDHRSR